MVFAAPPFVCQPSLKQGWLIHCVNVVSHPCFNDDWQKIQELFDQERKWMLGKMQEHIHEVNTMFVEERKKAMNRYKEYDGCNLGHYAQWFFWFFFTIDISVVSGGIVMLIAQLYGT